jgi:tripartite-type tricarboxylate transporter receptor subunit TctC
MYKLLRLAAGGTIALAAGSAPAQDNFPSQPIRMIMPFSAGGPTDMVARVMAQAVSGRIGQNIVVENRAGANGIIGTQAVAGAPADGHTLLIAPTSHTINPSLYKSLPYNTSRDFRSVIYIGNSPGLVVVTNADGPASDVRKFIEAAKLPDNKLSFGSAGNGNLTHLAGSYFNGVTGARLQHIPYKGAGEIVAALYRNEIQAAFLGPPQAVELLKAGKLRALAVTSAKRIPQLPDVPTMAESGYPNYLFDGGMQAAIYAPAATPTAVIQKLNREFNAALQEAEIRTRFETIGLDIVGGAPEVLDAQVERRLTFYSKLVRDSNIAPE